jgi:1,4-dihydroxy-2-naphthoyl-CoA hydrolase
MITIKRKINFYDCDPAGILFYGNIFFLCHAAYEELISSLNLKEDYWKNNEYVVPIISSNANYLSPLKTGDDLTIEVTVSELRDSSFELSYKCINQSGKICVEVKTVHVFLDKVKWEKMKIPAIIHSGLGKYFMG